MPGRALSQRLLALGGLVVIVGVVVGVLVLVGVIGDDDGGTSASGVPIEDVELVEPPREPGQEDLEVGVGVGDLASDFVISDFDGERLRLSDYRGKVVYLNFWATWCQPCVQELPEIQELQGRYPETLAVIAVNRSEGVDSAKAFLDELPRTDGGTGVGFTVNGLDPDDTLYDEYRALGMPVSVKRCGAALTSSGAGEPAHPLP
jgi:thiol-disulfide isomerase/thioredoxin